MRRSMSAFLKITLASIAIPVILSVGLGPAGAQSAPRPFYNSIPHERQNLPPPTVTSPGIVLTDETNATPAKSVDDANRKLAARTAEAIRWTTNHSLPNFINFPGQPCSDSIDDCLNFWKVIKPGEDNNEENLGFSLLAKMAYQDYFNDDAQGQVYRDQVRIKLSNEHPGTTGTSPNIDIGPLPFHWHGEYDVLLQSYVAMYYKYYDILDPDTKNKLFNELLSVRGPYPYFPGNYLLISASIPFIIPFGDYNVFVPETENHILMIETARYLTNQLLFQQEVANAAAEGRAPEHDQYDNNRNGGGQDGKPPLVVFILGMLQNILTSDFTEYNARPYQDYSMVAVMNLAAYAYDDRVKLAARMVLDYISA